MSHCEPDYLVVIKPWLREVVSRPSASWMHMFLRVGPPQSVQKCWPLGQTLCMGYLLESWQHLWSDCSLQRSKGGPEQLSYRVVHERLLWAHPLLPRQGSVLGSQYSLNLPPQCHSPCILITPSSWVMFPMASRTQRRAGNHTGSGQVYVEGKGAT